MRQKLSSDEISTYSKQITLEQIGIQGQMRLKQAKVLVIGLGGLGCPITLYLAISGIGYIGIIDYDNIEKSNLNRQILYTISDVNKNKVECATKKLKTINQNCSIIRHKYKLNEWNCLETISYYDIIVDATDNFKTRHIIDHSCHKLHKIYVYGAIDTFEGQVGIFNYKNGIKYKDLYQQQLTNRQINCNLNGIMGVHSGYIGNLQALETIKIILGISKKCQNFLITKRTLKLCINKKKIYSNRKKLNIINNKNIITKSSNLINTKEHYTKNYINIDLREENEFKQKDIKKSINIPIKKFKLKKTIKFLKDYTSTNTLYIYCNNNSKSKIASQILEKNYVKYKILLHNKQ